MTGPPTGRGRDIPVSVYERGPGLWERVTAVRPRRTSCSTIAGVAAAVPRWEPVTLYQSASWRRITSRSARPRVAIDAI